MKQGFRNVGFVGGLLVNILVFIISCAVLAGVFGKAGQIFADTKNKSRATDEMYAVFATARADGIGTVAANSAAGGAAGTPGGQVATYYYDKSWRPVDEAGARAFVLAYTVREEKTNAGTLYHIDATAVDDAENVVCEMSTAVYAPGEGGVPQ